MGLSHPYSRESPVPQPIRRETVSQAEESPT
jgi:hypothetical protein